MPSSLCSVPGQSLTFSSFYRNHNVAGAISQEAYIWASVIDASKTAMNIRYQLLPYIYTLFYLSHTTGSTVMRAMAWEFPNDPSLVAADRQFFLGPAILVTPVLNPGVKSVDGVFPGAGKGTVYYDWYTQRAVDAAAGQNMTIPAPLGHIPVYIRGGHVLPTQEPALVTRDARKNPWGLLVALNPEGAASGSLYIDDGESLIQNSTLYVEFTASKGTLSASARGTYMDLNPLANVTVMGVQHTVKKVTLNGKNLPGSCVSYDEAAKVLRLTGLNDATKGGAWMADWIMQWS